MKHSSLSRQASRARQNRRGIALLIVLAAIVLLTLLVIALLINGGSEVRTSKAYANGSTVKLLAQSAVNVVLAEINDATHDPTLCWASQPGMIRTYDNAGAAHKYYKLYSDTGMIGTGGFNAFGSNSGVPATWYSQKGVYIDLNEPISIAGTLHYPIVDGSQADLTASVPDVSGVSALTYGQPGSSSKAQVAGFWVEPQPTTPVNTAATVSNDVPMPVKWLYVLKNGQVIVPDSNNGGSTVTFTGTSGQPVPSATNPIVGRMAFWTDDESCKVNINTASESAPAGKVKNTKGASSLTGSFVDTPRVCSAFDESMAVYPAVQNEFQRYPGHPATVSLSSVFQDWTGDANYPENIYPLTPRTNNGGSYEGAVQYAAQNATTAAALPLRSDRLYTTVDEFLFQPNRTPNTSANSYSVGNGHLDAAGPGLAGSNPLDGPALEKARFFLTASSRAPDLNLFNLPRVCMWPVSQYNDTQHRTAYDNLIAFCETLGAPSASAASPNTNIYYFQRGDPLISTGKGWESQTENTDIKRNSQLLSYLTTLYGTPIPGFGGTFSGKYPQDINQILTEIFDYIRCTNLHDTSMVSTVTNFHYFSNTTTTPTAYNALTADDGVVMPTVTTLNGTSTKGFGRFPTISGAGMIFLAAAVGPKAPGPVNPPGTNANDVLAQAFDGLDGLSKTASEPTIPVGATRVQAALIFSLFDPSQGFFGEEPNVILAVTPNPKNPLQWNAGGAMSTMYFGNVSKSGTHPNGYAADGTNTYYLRGATANLTEQPPWGGELGVRYITGLYGSGTAYPLATGLPFTLNASPNPPVSNGTTYGILTDFTGSTIQFQGSVTVQVYLANNTSTALGITSANLGSYVIGPPVQTITFTFPAGSTCPVPTPASTSQNGVVSYNGNSVSVNSFNNSSVPVYGAPPPPGTINVVTSLSADSGRFYLSGSAQYPYPILPGDTVRSLVSASGDLRLTAAQATIPGGNQSGAFTTHPLFGQPTQPMAHSFVESNGLVYYGATRGQLVPNLVQYWVGGSAASGQTINTFSSFPYNNSPTTVESAGVFSCEPEGFAEVGGSASTSLSTVGVQAGPEGVSSGAPGDWDNGTGIVRDGPYINKPDEGDLGNGLPGQAIFYPAYFSNTYNSAGTTNRGLGYTGTAYFSPAREMPSAGMLGSLPTGVLSDRPWQTLLFHPDYSGQHIGATSPPDYLMLDFFHMPVVEPYAISEPLSTAGRINMNYLMVPFTYINRDTGIRAVLQSQQILSIPNSAAYGTGPANGYASNATVVKGAYKQNCSQSNFGLNYVTGNPAAYRFPINITETLKGFMARFNAGDIFRSAAEICSLDLVPTDTGAAYGAMQSYWQSHALTGDNSREKPYANIYPLLTTKSNTFTVHFRVQTLKKLNLPTSDPSKWQEGTDVVTAEYRGSQTVERYINPSDASFSGASGDFAASTPAPANNILPTLYKFRTVSSTQFAP